jgi:NAD(P)H dehydrogenase (quinone)
MKHLCPRKQIVMLILLTLAPAVSVAAAFASEAVPPKVGDRASPHVLVACYSPTGNTAQMARGVAEGIRRVPGVTAVVKQVDKVTKQDLEAADGIILGSPTYYANIPGKMKVDFTDKVGGAFATGGGQVGGKEHVVTGLLLFMLSSRMIVAGPFYRNEKTGSVWGEPGRLP